MQSISNSSIHNPPDSASSDPLNPKRLTYEEELGFQEACSSGDKQAVVAYLKEGCDANRIFSNFTTPLDLALNSGKYEVAELLIENGAKSDLVTFVRAKRVDIVAWVVARQASITLDTLRRSLEYLKNCPEMCKIIEGIVPKELMASSLAMGPSSRMISIESEGIVFEMLKGKGDLEKLSETVIDEAGNTVLHNTNSVTLIAKIIGEGLLPVNPVLNKEGWNALEWQVCQGKFQLAEILQKNGYRTNKTPAELVAKAIEHGIELNTDRYKFWALKQVAINAGIEYDWTQPDLASVSTRIAEHYLKETNIDPNDLSSISKILLDIDEKWANEILKHTRYKNNINGPALKVYRGIIGAFDDDYMKGLFKYGFKSLGDRGNALFTMATTATREESYKYHLDDWEVRGPFTSLNMSQALRYATKGSSSVNMKNSYGYLLVAHISSDQKRVLGTAYASMSHKDDEVIVNQVRPESITFIYKVDLEYNIVDRFDNPAWQDEVPLAIGGTLK